MHFILILLFFSILVFFLEILVTSYIQLIYYTCGWKTLIWLVKYSTLQQIQCPWQPI